MRRVDGAVAFRGGGFAPRNLPLAGAATLVGLVVLWQLADSLGLIPTLFLPAPANIGVALYHLTVSGELWKHLSASLARLAIGWVTGTVFGIGLGLAVGLSSLLRSPGMAVVSALFPIPKIALVPLFIIWFGIGEGSKIATLAFGVFFPTVITTAGGVDNVPRSLIRMAQSFGLRRSAIVRKIVLPAALPTIMTGLQVALPLSLIVAVVTEMLMGGYGLGGAMMTASRFANSVGVFAGIVEIAVVGYALVKIMAMTRRRLLIWHQEANEPTTA